MGQFKVTYLSSIAEFYKRLGIFKNTQELREAFGCASCFSMHFCSILENSRLIIYFSISVYKRFNYRN